MASWFDSLKQMLSPTPQPSAYDQAIQAARRARCAGDAQSAHAHALTAREHARYPEQISDAQFEIARALIGIGDGAGAESLADSIGRALPSARATAQQRILSGEIAAAAGDHDAARGHYEVAVRLLAKETTAVGYADVAALARGLLAEAALRDGGGRYAAHLLNEVLTKQSIQSDPALTAWLTGILGEAMAASGSAAEAERLLVVAANLSEVCGCTADVRRWALRLGDLAWADGRADAAAGHYARALQDADGSLNTGDRVHGLIVWSRALVAQGEHPQAVAQARRAHEAAESLADARLIAAAQGVLGEALQAGGDDSGALPYLRAALAVPDAVQIGTRRALAGALFAAGETDEALRLYAEAVTLADRAAQHETRRGAAALEAANLRRDWGLARLRQGDREGAIAVWAAAVPLYEGADAPAQAARLLCDIASERRASGAMARALKDIEAALMLVNSLPTVPSTPAESLTAAQAASNETRGVVLANAALTYAESADIESADSFFKEAITLADGTGDRLAQSSRLGNYGAFLLYVGRPRRAIVTLEMALAISKADGLDPHAAVQMDNLGLVYDALGELPRALDLHDEALTLTADPGWLAHIAASGAHTLISLNRADEAAARLEAHRPPADAPFAAIVWMIARGRVLLVAGDPDGAGAALDEAMASARRLEQRRMLADALTQHSQLLAARGERAGAAAAWEEARRIYLLRHMPQGKHSPEWLN